MAKKTKRRGPTPARTVRLEARGRPGQIKPTGERARKKRRANLITAAIISVLLAGAGTAITLQILGSSRPEGPPSGVRTFDVTDRDHVETSVVYPQTPPVGGNHNSVWQNCGFYGGPINSENAVHSLEHGAVWITFSPDLPSDQVSELRDLAGNRTYVLVSQFDDLPSPVVASAWGVQLELDSVSDLRLEHFVDYYRQGPQTPEPGATCAGGTGTPS
jgi:hypothetical protein